MQIVAVPLYDKDMSVQAYMFRDLKDNILFSTSQALNVFDGASKSESLAVLDQIGLETFTLGHPIFVPISEVLLMGKPQEQCSVPADKIVFILEEPLSNEELYLSEITKLCGLGYRFAANYNINFKKRDKFLELCTYIFLSQRPERLERTFQTLAHVKGNYQHLTVIAAHIYSDDVLQGLYGKGYKLYESRFYRPTEAGAPVAPLKVNAIRLINEVQDENFDFEMISNTVKSDPALSISLLRLVNTPSGGARNEIKSIPQAVAMLGQGEVRKWVTTAVSQSLGNDRPNEITRISLVRARFCENLAPLFELANFAGDLFLMGLFSVIDIILERPMPEAIEQVSVPENIKKALVQNEGVLYPVLKFVSDYEIASWASVSRQMIVHNISDADLSEAYLGALTWYRNLMLLGE